MILLIYIYPIENCKFKEGKNTLSTSLVTPMAMEMQSQSSKPKAGIGKDKQLSLDDYLSFIDNHKQINLNAKKLNQIIRMHGFAQIQRDAKTVLIEAVKSIVLMKPSRSTLNDENISSQAFATLKEVTGDLKKLNWQECCVTSVQTLNSANYNLVLNITDAPLAISKPKRSRKRRMPAILRNAAFDDDAAQIIGGSEESQSVCSSAAVGEGVRSMELVLRRMSDVNGEGDFGAAAGESSSILFPLHGSESIGR